jgi:hypothetical protein
MYFRRIEGLHKEYYTTNSSGNFAALARKLDDEDDKSWVVFAGEKDENPSLTNVTLEEAMDFIILNFSLSADPKQEKKEKKKR